MGAAKSPGPLTRSHVPRSAVWLLASAQAVGYRTIYCLYCAGPERPWGWVGWPPVCLRLAVSDAVGGAGENMADIGEGVVLGWRPLEGCDLGIKPCEFCGAVEEDLRTRLEAPGLACGGVDG